MHKFCKHEYYFKVNVDILYVREVTTPLQRLITISRETWILVISFYSPLEF